VVSDGTWKIADSGTHDNYYLGENYDARRQDPNWSKPGFDDSSWQQAPVQPAPTKTVVPALAQAMKVTETLKPVRVTGLSNGSKVYDFGRDTAGWGRISVSGRAGTTVRMVYGEQLNSDGSVSQFDAAQDPGVHVDTYTLDGTKSQMWEPSFTRHGFHYIQVSSTAPLSSFSIRARVVHNAVDSTGSFSSSNALLNAIHQNQRTTILNNLANIPTDTPWRDRQGWTADAYLNMSSADLNFGMKSFYEDWLRTYRDTQQADGSVPVIVPFPGGFWPSNDPSWSGTYVLDTWELYQHYGDRSFLSDNYDAMTKWMDLMASSIAHDGDIYTGFSFGDWSSPGTEKNGSLLASPENPDLTATANLYHEARTLAGIARVLGHAADAATYDGLADHIKTAFNAKFFDPKTNTYASGGNPFFKPSGTPGYRQTSNLVPLAYGLVPDGRRQAVLANLVDDIRSRGNHLNTGSIGTKLLLPTLTANGQSALAYALATQTTYPSWGYWVKSGATTSWETWSITDPTQSMDHPFLGTVEDWLYQDLAGIQPAAPGYAKVLVAPVVPQGLHQVLANVGTPRGEVCVTWVNEHGRLTVTVQSPQGTPTEVRLSLPGGDRTRTYEFAGGTHTILVS
jgi:alpha-L-rhamnosidase